MKHHWSNNTNLTSQSDEELNKLREEFDEDELFCKCWKQPTYKVYPRFKITEYKENFKILGTGFPLYFNFKFFTVLILLMWTLFVTIPAWIVNYNANDPENGVKQRLNSNQDSTFMTHPSIGNHGSGSDNYDDGSEIDKIVIINSVFIGFLMIASILLGIYQQIAHSKYEEDIVTASDFAVKVTNIPLDITENQLKEWLIEKHSYQTILHVVYWYNIDKIV